jgi:4-hydroxy-tetrahydrodipicolinate reductase
MGQALLRTAERIPNVAIASQIGRGDDLASVITLGDVVIDFTSHESTVPFARLCAQRGKAMVVGTTGHSEARCGKFPARFQWSGVPISRPASMRYSG